MMGPRDKQLTIDEETVEVLEIIEGCKDQYDYDDDNSEYYPEY